MYPLILQFNRDLEQRFPKSKEYGLNYRADGASFCIDIAVLLRESASSFKWTELAGIPQSALQPRSTSHRKENNPETSAWMQVLQQYYHPNTTDT